MDNENAPRSEIVLYQTEDGRTRIECRREVARQIDRYSLRSQALKITFAAGPRHAVRLARALRDVLRSRGADPIALPMAAPPIDLPPV